MQNKIKKNYSAIQLFSYSAGESGMTLILSLIIVSNILMIALAMGIFSMNQLKMTISAKESAYAIFAATSGLERALYDIRINNSCSSLTGNLSNNSSYSTDTTPPSPCDQSSSTIVSTGTYKQTSRKIEASW